MNLMKSYTDIKKSMGLRNIQLICVIVGAGVIGLIGYYGYGIYNTRFQRAAQVAFSESIDVYKQALAAAMNKGDVDKNVEGLWDEAEIAFKAGYAQNKSSDLAPFFLIFESQVLLKEGKKAEAYELLAEAVNKIPEKSPFFYLYKTKQALMEIDLKDGKSGSGLRGLDLLLDLSKNKNNMFRDLALFYAGEYYWSTNEIDKAREQYKALEAMNTDTPWAAQAKAKLKKIQ